MEPKSILEKKYEKNLEKRVEYLENANQWYYSALQLTASLKELHRDVERNMDPSHLFKLGGKYLKELVDFETMGFYMVSPGEANFYLTSCDPAEDSPIVEGEIERQIDLENFAWALRQNKALCLEDSNQEQKLILHSIGTQSRMIGMFVGRLKLPHQNIPAEQLTLISIIINNIASAMESGILYKIVNEQNQNLEQIVQDRTRKLELQTGKLIFENRERKKAQEDQKLIADELKISNQELQDFAFIASHDLQEPLRKVILFGDRVKSILDNALTGKCLDYFERMEKAAIRMQHLIDGLLQFSKVTTKAKKFEKTDLSKIILEAMDDLEIKIERSKARIEWTNLPTLESDGSQVRQLIKNLIDNSIKFQPAGQIPEINISGQLVENEIWTINFKDNGIGFDEKYLTNMFKPFERLHESLGHEGHGMGLTICQKIVSRHHGSISASSTPEKGSTFFITLPEKQEENPRKIRNIVLRPTFKSSNK